MRHIALYFLSDFLKETHEVKTRFSDEDPVVLKKSLTNLPYGSCLPLTLKSPLKAESMLQQVLNTLLRLAYLILPTNFTSGKY